MPSHDLIPHPSSPQGPLRSISVDIRLIAPAALSIRYRVAGSLDGILVPPRETPARTDELWRHTCFEAFIGQKGSEAYVEFNFSPSTRWAAYRFTAYREGMSEAMECPAPAIAVARTASKLTLTSELDLGWMSDGSLDAPLRIALSAVIENNAGAKSYWALAHPSEKPDFHHPDSFVCNLKKASRT